jgi:chromate transporter
MRQAGQADRGSTVRNGDSRATKTETRSRSASWCCLRSSWPRNPPNWILGAGAAVPAVALQAASRLVAPSRKRIGSERSQQVRWVVYALLGAVTAATVGTYLVPVLVACGVTEILVLRQGRPPPTGSSRAFFPAAVFHGAMLGGLGALVWVAFKVGALSYGGGFVIVPLMQHDAVTTYHWMTRSQFLNAVALGQVTPGPVVRPYPSSATRPGSEVGSWRR